MTAELARLRLIETAARDLLPTLESYSDDIDLIDFRAALRATPVADTAGIDADTLALAFQDCSCFTEDDAEKWAPHVAAEYNARLAAALRTPKPG